jgi:hypothetical protein
MEAGLGVHEVLHLDEGLAEPPVEEEPRPSPLRDDDEGSHVRDLSAASLLPTSLRHNAAGVMTRR